MLHGFIQQIELEILNKKQQNMKYTQTFCIYLPMAIFLVALAHKYPIHGEAVILVTFSFIKRHICEYIR